MSHMSDEQKLDRLEEVRTFLATPDMDDAEWIVEQVMKMLQVKLGETPKDLRA